MQELPDSEQLSNFEKLPEIVFVKYRLTAVVESVFYIDELTYDNLNFSQLEQMAIANADCSSAAWVAERIVSEVLNSEH
jgi:hypothetical protein